MTNIKIFDRLDSESLKKIKETEYTQIEKNKIQGFLLISLIRLQE